MAYAEKHGRGRRARWRDEDGSLRSASGFGTRKAAEGYGSDREAGHRAYAFTRGQLIEALTRLEVQPTGTGPPGPPAGQHSSGSTGTPKRSRTR